MAALFPASKHAERTCNYISQHDTVFNMNGITYPVTLNQIARFERQNTISINVYGLERFEKNYEVVGPLHYTKNKKQRHVNLLYFKNEDNCDGHYAWIKNLSRLLSAQLSRKAHKKWICDRCLQYFGSEALCQRHELDCALVDAVKITMPEEHEKWVKFKNFKNKEKHPFVVYADFECMTVPLHTCQPDPSRSYTDIHQHHVPFAVAYQVVCSYNDSLSFYRCYSGPSASTWFMNDMIKLAGVIESFYKNTVPLRMTYEDILNFANAKKCHICEKSFLSEEEKVHDHCHLTGEIINRLRNK